VSVRRAFRDTPLDCLVIGGGPAGLTAAIYLARFHLAVTVADAGDSRAALIPRTRNHAGFPKGIAGAELLSRMREQALLHGAVYSQVRIEKLDKDGDVFLARGGPHRFAARSVLLATGVSEPPARYGRGDAWPSAVSWAFALLPDLRWL
jgi:thioredoxin reductase (NADPH)